MQELLRKMVGLSEDKWIIELTQSEARWVMEEIEKDRAGMAAGFLIAKAVRKED